jgi:hypothetical protein
MNLGYDVVPVRKTADIHPAWQGVDVTSLVCPWCESTSVRPRSSNYSNDKAVCRDCGGQGAIGAFKTSSKTAGDDYPDSPDPREGGDQFNRHERGAPRESCPGCSGRGFITGKGFNGGPPTCPACSGTGYKTSSLTVTAADPEDYDDEDWEEYRRGHASGKSGESLRDSATEPFANGHFDGRRGHPVDGPDKTSSLTVTAKEVGYYVVSRNGVPISGPYATRSDAAPNMIEQRGAAVMFIGPGNSSEWDALKAKQFPFGLNTVNGSRKEAYEQYGENPYLECYSCGWNGNLDECSVPGICPLCFHKGLRDGSGLVYNAAVHTDKPKPRNHKASLEALAWGPDQHNGEVGLDFHEFPEDPEYIDPRDYEEYDDDDEEEWDVPQRWEAARRHKFVEDKNWGDESSCTSCGKPKGDSVHTDSAHATASLLEERYATVRRLSSLRHFAEDEDDLGYEKQPKGLGDQVDTGMAPASEIQDPNPLAGQDLERTPRNLAEAALWAQATNSCVYCGDQVTDRSHSTSVSDGMGGMEIAHDYCADDRDYPQDTPHDQLDDPWNGQENPLGRGWGDPPLGY